MSNFVHLRPQSSYSLLKSIVKIKELVRLIREMKMQAVCLMDVYNMFGALEFAIEASKIGIQPIQGCLIKMEYKDEYGEKCTADLPIIAKNDIGYKNMLHLASLLYTKSECTLPAPLNWREVAEYKKGLIVLSGYTEGIVGKAILNNQISSARSYSKKLLELFDENFYFEIMRHGFEDEKAIENRYLKISQELGIPVIATNKTLFLKKEMKDIHDTFLCISNNKIEEKYKNSELYLKSPEQMIELFKDIPSAIYNTVELAKRCSTMARTKSPILPTFSKDEPEEESIKKLSFSGLNKKLEKKFFYEKINPATQEEIKKKYEKRLRYELDLICKMKFAGYFLIVSDFVRWAKDSDIPVGPGRGSGVGSITAWSLFITDVDPIAFGLIFERFLNPDRISMPDFDIDFCKEGRNKVIDYVRKKYGNNRVANIITFGSLQAKAAVKDVARVLGLRFDIANTITNFIPFNAVNPVTLSKAIETVPQLKNLQEGKIVEEIQLGEYDDIDEIRNLIVKTLDISLHLEGLPRHASIHAAGMIISGTDLVNLLPLYKMSTDGPLLVQYSMKYAELSGLIKFDFLGLQTLTIISNCSKLVKESGIEINIDDLPLDDKKTYNLLRTPKLQGIFQLESAGMRDSLYKLQPDSIKDIMALTSLYRPGPMDNIPTYISCKFGNKKIKYPHALLENILKPTYGVIIYQEQVMEIAKSLANYTLSQADILRRAMGKKIASEMKMQEKTFIDGAEKNKIDPKLASEIYNLVSKFAGYGFNKSHAAAYSIISYRTAYLKAHYPLEFFVAFLNLEMQDMHKINTLINESKKFGIKLDKICINKCYDIFKVSKNNKKLSIVFGLGALKNVGSSLAKEIVEEREKKGKFSSIFDFVERIQSNNMNKRALECLIQSGCFDSLYENRSELFSNVDKLVSYSSTINSDNRTNQISFFNQKDIKIELKESNPWSKREMSMKEFDITGIFITTHPLKIFEVFFKQNNIQTIKSLSELQNGVYQVKIAGIIQKKDVRTSARGLFINLVLSDAYDNFEASIFNEELLKEKNSVLHPKSIVILECDVSKYGDTNRLIINSVESIKDYMQNNPYEIIIPPLKETEFLEVVNILKNKRSSNDRSNVNITIFMKAAKGLNAKIEIKDNILIDEKGLEKILKFT